MARLRDQIDNLEQQNEDENKKPKVSVVNKMTKHKGLAKDKPISAKVNSDIYHTFTLICQYKGISNNSAINMILNEYVRDHAYLLEEEN